MKQEVGSEVGSDVRSSSRAGHTEDAETTHTQRHCMAPMALCNLLLSATPRRMPILWQA